MTIEVTAPRPTEGEILAYRLEQERAEQELDIYNNLLEEANERGRSFAGHLNSLDAAGILEGPAGNRYDLFMKKYEQDMDYQKRFGDQLLKERRIGKTKNDEDMDPFVLKELMKQRQILDNLAEKSVKGISSGEYTRLANGGSPEQELVNQRIAELMMEEPVNEMRAVSPDMFERQKLGIERLLSNLYEPRRARDIAETISTGIDFTPLGDPAAIAEGFQMMGDDQPFMGAALMAGSVFTNMPANKLKGLLKKADEKLDNLRTRQYQAESKMKGGLSKADFDEGFKESNKVQAEINKTEKEITEIKEALNPTAVPESGTRRSRRKEIIKNNLMEAKQATLTAKEGYGKASTQLDEVLQPYIRLTPEERTAQTAKEGYEKASDYLDKVLGKLSGSKSILPEKEALERSDRFLNIKSDGRSYGFHKKGESTSWFIDPETNEVFKWYSGEGATPKGYHVRREVPDFVRKLQESSRRNQPKQVKGIINATPETQKLYQELLDSPSAINTPRHNKVGKDASEQLREIKKQVEESDLEDRNEVLRLLAQLRDKKPK